mmetsp:Transcript_16302/g.35706  ORF Transcript_16302/g.35706 Transcript_16302/m.35706 type:complete len:404 (+) Transcript_16302:49-1260(+)
MGPPPRPSTGDIWSHPGGVATRFDPEGAGAILRCWAVHKPSADPRPPATPALPVPAPSEPARETLAGVQAPPHSPFTALIVNRTGNAGEQALKDRYAKYAVEKEQARQPMRIRMTQGARAKIARSRQLAQKVVARDRWLMSKFRDVPSHFAMERAMANSFSEPILRTAQRADDQQRPLAKAPVLEWPHDQSATGVRSAVAAPPSCSLAAPPATNLSVQRPGGAPAETATLGDAAGFTQKAISQLSVARTPSALASAPLPEAQTMLNALGAAVGADNVRDSLKLRQCLVACLNELDERQGPERAANLAVVGAPRGSEPWKQEPGQRRRPASAGALRRPDCRGSEVVCPRSALESTRLCRLQSQPRELPASMVKGARPFAATRIASSVRRPGQRDPLALRVTTCW